jgi:glycosyltransferase involved in cell wall biosynthesis
MLTPFTISSVLLPLAALGVLAYIQWWWSILKHWLPISTPKAKVSIETNTSINASPHANTKIPGISTLIPLRNEALRLQPLLDSLTKIQAPGEWEIVFCDDHSIDNSLYIIQHFIENNPEINARVVQLSNAETGKKSALTAGIAQAKFEIIHTTDADCRLHPNLYFHLLKNIKQPQIELVLGRVEFTTNFAFQGHSTKSNVNSQGLTFNPNRESPAGLLELNRKSHRLLQQYQLIENSALIALGYSEFLKKNPAAANGANLMFKKSAFLDLGGYSGNTQFASGDDVFTLEKFLLHNPDSVAFCTHPHATVVTDVENNFDSFKNQRIRWMKKTFLQKTQKTALKQTFMGIFLLGFWVMSIEAVLSAHYESMALLWLGKLCVDSACVSLLLRNHPQKPCLPDIVLCSILQVLWLPTLGLLAANNQFQWKGRSHSA